MNGTLRSWIHFVQLRSANGTQKEHQLIAIEAGEIISDLYGINIFALDS
jgi:thymidylate synthase (FAD)